MRKPRTLQPDQVFEGLGYCIYCGARDRPLTDEHIIPYSLNGNLVMMSASCTECAVHTSKVERWVTKDYFGPLRNALNLPTRRPDLRSSKISAVAVSNGKRINVEYDWSEYPAAIKLPVLAQPGIIGGKDGPKPGSVFMWHITLDAEKRKIDPGIEYQFDLDKWLLYVAKVCHVAGCAYLGDESKRYIQCLPPLILGKDKNLSRFVGGASCDNLVNAGASGHTALSSKISFEGRPTDDGRDCLFVNYQFLSDYGGPTYQACFGQTPVAAGRLQETAFRQPRARGTDEKKKKAPDPDQVITHAEIKVSEFEGAFPITVGLVSKIDTQIRQFDLDVQEFLKRNPTVAIFDELRNPPQFSSNMSLFSTENVPSELAEVFACIVSQVREALDKLVHEAMDSKHDVLSSLSFPFARRKAHLDIMISERMKGASKQVQDVVRSLQPFRGGNDALWAAYGLGTQKVALEVLVSSATATVQGAPNAPYLVYDDVYDEVPQEISDRVPLKPGWVRLGLSTKSKLSVSIKKGLTCGGQDAVQLLINMKNALCHAVQEMSALKN